MRRERSCGCVVYKEREFLLIQSVHTKNWSAPKGRMERGETEEQTARREVFEETGLKNLRFVPGFRKTNRYTARRPGKFVGREDVFFLAEAPRKEIRLSHEHAAYEWLSFPDAIARARFPVFKSILAKAARELDPRFSVPPARKKPPVSSTD